LDPHPEPARAVKQFFDWCEAHRVGLDDIEPIAIAAMAESEVRRNKNYDRRFQAVAIEMSERALDLQALAFKHAQQVNSALALSGRQSQEYLLGLT